MERVALVARCGGARCAALLRLSTSRCGDDPLADAVRARPDGVLLHTDCLGPCHVGAVAAIGWAHSDDHCLTWAAPPELACGVDHADAAGSLAARLERGATPPPASAVAARPTIHDDEEQT